MQMAWTNWAHDPDLDPSNVDSMTCMIMDINQMTEKKNQIFTKKLEGDDSSEEEDILFIKGAPHPDQVKKMKKSIFKNMDYQEFEKSMHK